MLGQNTKSFLTVKVLPSDIRQSPVSDDQMRKFWLVVHRVESLWFNLNFIRHWLECCNGIAEVGFPDSRQA